MDTYEISIFFTPNISILAPIYLDISSWIYNKNNKGWDILQHIGTSYLQNIKGKGGAQWYGVHLIILKLGIEKKMHISLKIHNKVNNSVNVPNSHLKIHYFAFIHCHIIA